MAKKATAQAAPKAAEQAAAPSPVIFASYREAAAMMLEAVANLPLHEALDRLRRAYDDQVPGTAQRALLSARIALLRDNIPVRAVLSVPPAPVAVAPEPPKPLKAGALSTLDLDAAAKMLFAATEDDEEEEQAPPAKAAPAAVSAVGDIFAMMEDDDPEEVETANPAANASPDWGSAAFAAFDELSGEDVEIVDLMAEPDTQPAPELEPVAVPKKTKPRKAKSATPVEDIAAAFAEATAEPEPEAENPPVFHATPPDTFAADVSADMSALAALIPSEDAAQPETAPAKPAKAKKAKPAAVADLGAAFAAMSDDGDDGPVAPPDELVMAVADRLAGFDDEAAAPLPPVKAAKPKKAKAGMSDTDVAASLAALIGDGPAAPAAPAPAMLDPEVSDRLTALETAFAEDAKPKKGKKAPTDLSAVAATFAALNNTDE